MPYFPTDESVEARRDFLATLLYPTETPSHALTQLVRESGHGLLSARSSREATDLVHRSVAQASHLGEKHAAARLAGLLAPRVTPTVYVPFSTLSALGNH